MTITMGRLIAGLYDDFTRRYHDDELAAVATEVMLDELLARIRRAQRPRRAGRDGAATIPAGPRALRRAA